MPKPTIKAGPASNHEGTEEIIREFQHGGSGGLLSIRRFDQGRAGAGLRVDLYRLDPDVRVVVESANLVVNITTVLVYTPDSADNNVSVHLTDDSVRQLLVNNYARHYVDDEEVEDDDDQTAERFAGMTLEQLKDFCEAEGNLTIEIEEHHLGATP